MTALTINEAAATTGWSPRMLRYVEQLGLVDAPRSAVGYRLYGPAQLQRLRTLRELLEQHDATLAEVGFALRLRREPALAADLSTWFDSEPQRPRAAPAAPVPFAGTAGTASTSHELDDAAWLAFEQAKHQQLLNR